jgi:hypothetical protein
MATFTDYTPQIVENKLCIWLQSFGWAPAKQASEFKAGEKMLFNFGISNEVINVKETSKAFVTVTVKGSSGQLFTYRKKKSALVAIAN